MKYNPLGYDKDGYNADGFNADGKHRDTDTIYNPQGYDINGYDINGFDADGNYRDGTEYDRYGYNAAGYNAAGYNERGYDSAGVHKDDFTTLAAANESIADIWSNEITMWVLDSSDDHIYAYNMETKERDEPKEFTAATLTAAGNDNPQGMWSDETTMWVSDPSDDHIYAYNMETKERDETKEITPLFANGNYQAGSLWANTETMWVVDIAAGIYAYDYTIDTTGSITVTYKVSKEFAQSIFTAAGNSTHRRIWSNGTTMWVTDATDKKIYAYDYTIDTAGNITATYNASKDFDKSILSAAGNTDPTGIWSNGTTIWVSNLTGQKILAYDLATQERP